MSTCTKCGALVAPSISLAPVCTNCGGVAALYGRPVYATPPLEEAEAIKEACPYDLLAAAERERDVARLEKHTLAAHFATAKADRGKLRTALRYLIEQAATSLPESNHALRIARDTLKDTQ